jgi:hypothetical protein
MKRILLFGYLLIGPVVALLAQKKNESYVYHLRRATGPVKLDGQPDDPAWAPAQVATDFWQVQPLDTGRANTKTEVRMVYDDQNLYVLAVCHQTKPGAYVVESLRRDFAFNRNDNFFIALDTFDDLFNGFTIGANAQGAQWDGLIAAGNNTNLSWDNRWRSEVRNDGQRWVLEMAIPFKTLRYKAGVKRWGINFCRLDLTANEKSAWAPVPRQFPSLTLAFTGVLLWDQEPPRPGTNFSLIPYVAASAGRNHERGEAGRQRFDAGLDAKLAVTSSLNLDLTVNPDFSQVEVDRQQVNLDRFELFFPERRQFFLENGDLFGNFGYTSIRPFFSRRIGLNAPIRAGARLSGKLDKNWRIGAMMMQTGRNADGLPPQNFGVLALQRQVFARSTVTGLLVNKETFDYEAVNGNVPGLTRFNRTAGLEYNLLSADNRWTGKALYLRSFGPLASHRDHTIAANLAYNSRQLSLSAQYEHVGQNFRAEVGFVPRLGYHSLEPRAGFLFFPKSKLLVSHGPMVGTTSFWDQQGQYTENETFVSYRVNFLNRSDFMVWMGHNYVKLLRDFDPTNFVGANLAAGTEHRWRSWGTEFNSKPQSVLTYSFSTRYGGFYANGHRLRLQGELGYRFQPYVALALSANFNRIDFGTDEVLPTALRDWRYDFWLVGPRLDVTLTNKLFITNFLQYNNQAQNINLNVRFQWRYSPASDLFLVYTDNHFSDNWGIRNRALVFKWTYWWNV